MTSSVYHKWCNNKVHSLSEPRDYNNAARHHYYATLGVSRTRIIKAYAHLHVARVSIISVNSRCTYLSEILGRFVVGTADNCSGVVNIFPNNLSPAVVVVVVVSVDRRPTASTYDTER